MKKGTATAIDRRSVLRLGAGLGLGSALGPWVAAEEGKDGALQRFSSKHRSEEEFKNPVLAAPDWLRDAVAYEVVVRAFNHPDYQHPEKWENPKGCAPYSSLTEKLGYLQDLGITLVVLYTVYDHTPGTNLYAHRFEREAPELGTMADIKELVEEAHNKGIRVISNTNHYGVASSSPMLQERPDWFEDRRKLICGQPLFDLRHPETAEYIVKSHVDWTRNTGLDGWRIDMSHVTYLKAIWDRIMSACAEAGHRILLATEAHHLEGHIEGGGKPGSVAVPEGPERIFDMEAFFQQDQTSAKDPYRFKEISSHNCKLKWPHNVDREKYPRQGCYQIQGSRFLFGHNYIFAPYVPWMFAGEEFAASHLAVPSFLPVLQEHGRQIEIATPGKLLHAYLDWDDLERNQGVFQDMRRILNIRRANRDVLHSKHHETNLVNVPCRAKPEAKAKPYARFISGKKAIVIVGNESTTNDIAFTLNIPLARFGLGDAANLRVTDLWTGERQVRNKGQLKEYEVRVPKDKSPGGGVRAIKIERTG
jgi:hypothetical protein